MKKIATAALLMFLGIASAQFKISVEVPATLSDKEAYIYTYNGSKPILVTKAIKKGNAFTYKYETAYKGIMRLYLPENNFSANFVTENRDVELKLTTNSNGNITGTEYVDDANIAMERMQNLEEKRSKILPALLQIKLFYKPTDEFSANLEKEIERLSAPVSAVNKNDTFLNYFSDATATFLSPDKKPTADALRNFLSTSNEYLETSTLLRPLLLAYLNTSAGGSTSDITNSLLSAVNIETPRGQTILSELIDIFDSYGMPALKAEYLKRASDLKCTITPRLAETIQKNKDLEIGAVFKDYVFKNAHNTAAKSIAGVKAAKKIIVFWSSTCSHCEQELPQLLEKYRQLKAQNVEIIGLSVDNDKSSYESKIASFPWINDAEMKGWESSYAETYNVHATPTYFILDANNKILAKPDHAPDVLEFFKLK